VHKGFEFIRSEESPTEIRRPEIKGDPPLNAEYEASLGIRTDHG
jgi:hypothetical protein